MTKVGWADKSKFFLPVWMHCQTELIGDKEKIVNVEEIISASVKGRRHMSSGGYKKEQDLEKERFKKGAWSEGKETHELKRFEKGAEVHTSSKGLSSL